MEDLTPFDKALFDEIKRLEESKKVENIVPHYILYRDAISILQNALNRLYKTGRIYVGKTINDKYISTDI